MAINETAKDAVEDLKHQDFFRMIQDPSVPAADKAGVRTEKLEEFIHSTVNAGQGLSHWGENIEAKLRSGGATVPELLSEIKKMRSIETKVAMLGIEKVRAENGYTEEGHKVETAPIDVKPDPVTPETQSAYSAAQASKAEKSQTVDS
jgi:hypothetical protein